MELAAVIRSEGGVTTRDRLLVAGFPPRAITWAVREGSILRIRRAHYAVPDAPLDRRIAVASGGRLGARSALSSYGVWTVGDGTVHVSWPAHGNVARPARISGYPDLRRSGGVDISPHWRVRRLSTHRECWRESIEEALAQHLLTADDRETVAAMDSVLHIGALSTGSVASILERMPRRQRRLAAAVDGGADSGLESFARFWLWREGISYLAHPVLAGLEVDLLVGDSLVIETDGREFHKPRRGIRAGSPPRQPARVTRVRGRPIQLSPGRRRMGCLRRPDSHSSLPPGSPQADRTLTTRPVRRCTRVSPEPPFASPEVRDPEPVFTG